MTRPTDNTFTALPNAQLRAQGEAILHISAEVRGIISEDEDLDPLIKAEVLADLDRLDEAGNWLRSASSITLSAGQPTTLSAGDGTNA